jgi:hypothetical protein
MMPASESIPAKSKWQGWLSKALLFIVSLLVFMEGGARIALWINPVRRRITGFDDSSYRLQWVRLHQIHQEWTGQYAIYHPTLGWTLKSNIKGMSVFSGKILNSNSKGFRGKEEYEYRRTIGKQRIIVLGDSFTFGEEVSDDETYSSKLESGLQNIEVLNLGVQGYGNDQMLLRLQEEGIKYHPDIVVLGFTYIDIYRNIESFFAFAKPRFRLGAEGLKLTNVPVPTPEHVLSAEPYRPKALDILEILHQKLRWSLGQNEKEARAVTRLLLGQIASTTRSIGAVPVFVYLPVYEEIQPIPKGSFLLTANSPSVANREEYLHQVCQEQDIPCLFLRPRFREEVEKGVNFDPERHWNAQAHKVAAQEMIDFLVTNRLIQDKSNWGDPRSDSAPRSCAKSR